MGGLKDAINAAAKLAGIENYTVKELPVFEDPYTQNYFPVKRRSKNEYSEEGTW